MPFLLSFATVPQANRTANNVRNNVSVIYSCSSTCFSLTVPLNVCPLLIFARHQLGFWGVKRLTGMYLLEPFGHGRLTNIPGHCANMSCGGSETAHLIGRECLMNLQITSSYPRTRTDWVSLARLELVCPLQHLIAMKTKTVGAAPRHADPRRKGAVKYCLRHDDVGAARNSTTSLQHLPSTISTFVRHAKKPSVTLGKIFHRCTSGLVYSALNPKPADPSGNAGMLRI